MLTFFFKQFLFLHLFLYIPVYLCAYIHGLVHIMCRSSLTSTPSRWQLPRQVPARFPGLSSQRSQVNIALISTIHGAWHFVAVSLTLSSSVLSGSKTPRLATPTPIIASPLCPKCGTIKESGKRSCCARGGAWFKNCGDAGDAQFDHTWAEGIQACNGKLFRNHFLYNTLMCVLCQQIHLLCL